MHLKDTEIVWIPKDQPDLLLVMNKGHKPPRDQEMFLLKSADLLARLVREASPAEIEDANRRLRENLPEEEQTWLPPDLLDDPATPRALFNNPASLGSRLHEWKETVEEAMSGNLELIPQPEARPMAEELSLESYLSRFL